MCRRRYKECLTFNIPDTEATGPAHYVQDHIDLGIRDGKRKKCGSGFFEGWIQTVDSV